VFQLISSASLQTNTFVRSHSFLGMKRPNSSLAEVSKSDIFLSKK